MTIPLAGVSAAEVARGSPKCENVADSDVGGESCAAFFVARKEETLASFKKLSNPIQRSVAEPVARMWPRSIKFKRSGSRQTLTLNHDLVLIAR